MGTLPYTSAIGATKMYNDNYGRDRSQYQGTGKTICQPDVQLPPVKFYEGTDKKVIRKELLDSDACKCAEAFLAFGNKKEKIKSSQLRKFYGTAKSLELAGKAKSFTVILPQIKLMKAKVAYAQSRGVVPNSFKSWLTSCVDAIADEKDFEAFLLHFEAVVGFAYGAGLKDND